MKAVDALLQVYNYLKPILDVGILAVIIYKTYEMLSKTNGVIKAVIIVLGSYAIATILQLETILWLLNIIAPGLVIGFAIIFQPELRKIFLRLGQSQWFAFGTRSKHTYVDSVLLAAEMLSKQRRGMLCVFLRHTKLENVVNTGTKLNADISTNLLMTIFSMDTALHDGACFIQGNKVVAAGCFLPLSEQYDIKKTFGTRHRAALGVCEVSDAVVLIVSEESGAISLAYDSKLHYDLTTQEARKVLENLLEITPNDAIIEDTIDESKPVN
ncbi:MAG: diadenylate cyclase CdaA [Treponema sp.]|nr:diadenylate cyclase CdaA [Treponema sp.]